MTETRAIAKIRYRIDTASQLVGNGADGKEFEDLEMAIQALEEIQEFRKQGITIEKALDMMCDLAGAENLIEQYRAIGTVEYIKEQLNLAVDVYDKSERLINTTMDMLAEYQSIGTIEECRTAVERMKPKKVEIKPWSPARCPACGYTLSESQGDGYYSHPTFLGRCPIEDCGQVLDWSE